MVTPRTILIVDQNRMLADLLVHELTGDRIRVISAISEDQARRFLRELHPELMILGEDFPHKSLIEYIRSSDEPVALMGLTRSSEMHHRLAAMGLEYVFNTTQGLMPLIYAIRNYMTESETPTESAMEVLLVDSHPQTLRDLSILFERLGYSAVVAKDGDQALKLVENRPGLAAVLLELRLPGRGGLEILREIHELRPGLGVILMSNLRDSEIARHAVKLGAFDYVTKPLEFGSLEGTIIACLSSTEYRTRTWWNRFTRRKAASS